MSIRGDEHKVDSKAQSWTSGAWWYDRCDRRTRRGGLRAGGQALAHMRPQLRGAGKAVETVSALRQTVVAIAQRYRVADLVWFA